MAENEKVLRPEEVLAEEVKSKEPEKLDSVLGKPSVAESKKVLRPEEVLAEEVKSKEPEKLESVFGKPTVTWNDCLEEIHSAVSGNDSQRLKNIMELDIFKEPQFWTYEDFMLKENFKYYCLGHSLDCKWYKPIEDACRQASPECLKMLLKGNVWQDKWRLGRVLWSGMLTCILEMNEEPIHDLDEYIECLKILLSHGTCVWNDDMWSVHDFRISLQHTTRHVKMLYAAGLPLDVYDCKEDRAIVRTDSTGFLKYLLRKFCPKKDRKGLFHAGQLKEICRDEIRRRVIMDGWNPNIFCFAKQMIDDGHLTPEVANFLVYDLYDDVFDFEEQ